MVKQKGIKSYVYKRVFFEKILPYSLMSVIAVILVFPYFYMVMKSLMTSEEVIQSVPKVFPQSPQFINYVSIFTEKNYLKATLNTMYIIVFNSVAIPLSASIIAYSFAKLKWIGKNVMFALMMSTIMLPGVATQIPLYVMFASFNWIDTLLPFTIPNLFGGSAIFIFLIRQFMLNVPKDIDDAAKIDGANAWTRYFTIMLPLCKPVLMYIIVNIFIMNWGDFYGPLIYMSSSEAPRTLAYVVFLDSTQKEAATYYANLRMAGGVFMSIIPAALFFAFQKQLVQGVITTGLKG